MPDGQLRSARTRSAVDAVIESLPAALSPSVAPVACRLIARAETMGVIAQVGEHGSLDFGISRLEEALRGLDSAGIGRRHLAPDLHLDLRGGLELLSEEVENSPSPATEWASVTAILGGELVATLCGLHESSVRRYLKGERTTPDPVAWKLHFLAMVCADLLTGYNHFCVRRWFVRPRSALDGNAPRDLLAGGWDPDDDGPRAVARLAGQLITMTAT